ncbi:MAG: hypothetical protein HQK96_18490 [Nitrospirae bacterium]|nr:hypothetical protein [Nitrospirota bacterium]
MLKETLEKAQLAEAQLKMPKVKILLIANEDVEIQIVGQKKAVTFTTSIAHLGEFGKSLEEAMGWRKASWE